MNNRRNRYLEDRAMRRSMSRDYARGGRGRDYNYQMDGRNPYGSKGGYVRSDRSNGNYDSRMDYNYDYAESNRGYNSRGSSDYRGQDYHYTNERYGEYPRDYEHMDYQMMGYGRISPMHRDYGRGGRDYNNYDYGMDYAKEDEEYHKELKKLTEKLREKDRFRISKEQVIKQARNMNINFDEFSEEEFYLVYLMSIADYPSLANDYNMYIKHAKDWLESKNTKLKNSDKLCAYIYEVVLAKEEDDD